MVDRDLRRNGSAGQDRPAHYPIKGERSRGCKSLRAALERECKQEPAAFLMEMSRFAQPGEDGKPPSYSSHTHTLMNKGSCPTREGEWGLYRVPDTQGGQPSGCQGEEGGVFMPSHGNRRNSGHPAAPLGPIQLKGDARAVSSGGLDVESPPQAHTSSMFFEESLFARV